jgi:hypothetical protein
MSQSPTASAATPDVIQDGEPTVVTDATSDAPVFITEQQVVFSTAAARSLRPPSICRRLIDVIRVVGAALQLPPATTPPAAQQLPRDVPHGPRNGPTMNSLHTIVIVVSLALFAVGVHDLQLWLERWDHERHFND